MLKKAAIVIGSLVVICGLGAGAYFGLRHPSPIPARIKAQITFPIFYPAASPIIVIDKSTIKYDQSAGVLSFIVKDGSTNCTVTEQSTPDGFVDVPAAYDKLIETLNGYATFDTPQGTVNLTHPKEFNGQQSAAMNTKGTLMFVHPTNGALSEDQWKQFFNYLNIIK